MFEKLKALVRRVDFYLRNESYRTASESYVSSIDDLFGDPNNNPDPLRTRVYWCVRRFWVNHWLCNWDKPYDAVIFAYQRVTRGWDDRAVWSVDYWLDSMMPAILRKLKEDKHGIPIDMFDDLPMNDQGYHDKPEMEIAEARWDTVIDKMIAGFEASRRVKDATYEGELGPYPLNRPKGMPKDEWEQVRHEHYLKAEELRKRDEVIFKEGLALFAEHYWSLWD